MSQSTRLRVFALPLTRPTRGVGVGGEGRPAYVYYHVQSPPEPLSKNPNMIKKMMDKALDTWTSFGKQDKTSWKFKLYNWGEKVADRVEFEETALKHVNTSFKPNADTTVHQLEHSKAQFIHPASLKNSLEAWRKHVQHREPYHKRYMLLWSLGLPITAPIGIAPIIPNVPFYFCAWRAWSHWRAWRATTYLNQLLTAESFEPSTNTALDQIYDNSSPSSSLASDSHSTSERTSSTTDVDTNTNQSSPDSSTTTTPPPSNTSITTSSPAIEDQLWLREGDVPRLVDVLQLQPSVGNEILRAIEQVRLRLRKELKAQQQKQQEQAKSGSPLDEGQIQNKKDN